MEVSFPRGGTKRVYDAAFKKEDDLFKVNVGTKHEKVKKKKFEKKIKETPGSDVLPVVIEQLSYQTSSTGMVVLGCVDAVFDYSVKFVLPGGLIGTVPITKISEPYTNLLKTFSEDPESVSEIVVSPPSMFVPGMCFPVKIVEKSNDTHPKKGLLLSLDPKEVNESLTPSCLYHEMTVLAAVESVEDHGYVMDVGIVGTKGFLNHSGATAFIQKRNDGRPLAIGQPLLCEINLERFGKKPLNERILPLIAKHKASQSLVLHDNFNLHNALPGITVKVQVQKVRYTGLIVDCFGFGGCIWKDHLREPWDVPEKYSIEQELECTLLYQSPVTHTLHFTLLPCPTPRNFQKRFSSFKVGDIIREADVARVERNCIYLQLENKTKALAPKSQLSDLDEIIVSEMFKIGDRHSCRILRFNPFETLAFVSLKRSVLQQHIIPSDEVKVGAKFEGIIVKILEQGMIVKVAEGVTGYVRDIHATDIPLSDFAKRFTIGQKIRCRVLQVSQTGEKISILLTCKKMLVKSKVPPLEDYNEAVPDCVAEGVVVKIAGKGLLVTFYGDVKGWISIREVSYEYITDLKEHFYMGQVVKCRVISCIPEERRLLLSLKLDSLKNKSDERKEGKITFGNIFDVIVTKRTSDGLDVKVQPSGLDAFLPVNHLSDHPKLCKILLSVYSEGDTISRVVCFANKHRIVMSKKHSLIQSAQNGSLPMTFEDVQPNLVYRGAVKGFATYGMFIDIGNGISGLAHIKTISDGQLSHINNAGYFTHSSVAVKVLRASTETRHLDFSARLKDVYDGDTDQSLDLLESFLIDWNDIINCPAHDQNSTRKGMIKFKVGTIVASTVTMVTDEGVLCRLEGNVKGFAVIHHLGGLDCETGKQYDSLVLHVDVVNECVELALSPSLLEKSKEGSPQKIHLGQVYTGTVMMLRDHFVLAFLDKAGVLVYLPVRMHTNDMVGYAYGLGEKVSILVSRIINGQILGLVEPKSKGKNIRKVQKEKRDVLNKEMLFSHCENQQTGKKGKEVFETRNDRFRNKMDPVNKQDQLQNVKTFHLSRTSENDTKADKGNVRMSKKEAIGHREEHGPLNLELGDLLPAVITSVKKFQLNVLVDGTLKGRVHITEIDDSVPEGVNPLEKFQSGQEVEVRVIGKRNRKRVKFLPLSHCSTRVFLDFALKQKVFRLKDINCGQELTGFVQEFSRSCLWVRLTPEKTGCIDLLHLSQNLNILRKAEKKFLPSQAIKVKVLSVDQKGPVQLTRIKETKMDEGRYVLGLVLSARRDLGVFIRLPGGYRGTIGLTDLMDKYRPASIIMEEIIKKKFVRCCILQVDHETKTCRLSLRPSRFKKVNVVDPEVENVDSIKEGSVLRGFFTSFKNSSSNVSLGYDVKGSLPHSCFPKSVRSNLREHIPLGTVLKVRVECIGQEQISLSLLNYEVDDTVKNDNVSKIQDSRGEHVQRKRQRLSVCEMDTQERIHGENAFNENTKSAGKVSNERNADLPRLELEVGFDWNVEATPNLDSLAKNYNHLKHSASDSDADEEDAEAQKKVKKKSKKQKLEEAKLEEQKLFKEERRLMVSEWQPETVDDFDRMVASSPNSSLVWLKYMAFHLQQAEVEKARAIAKKAIETICFRDEQEKLNVWVAMLNLENLYGTVESLRDVFQLALQQNEPIKVYSHMVDIYDRSEKVQEAEEMYSTMIKKFRKNKDIWISFGIFYMKHGKPDAARQLMQRSLNSLDKKDHVDIISKFAQLEFKFGDKERGKTMFEGIVGSYPKRTDQWSIYIDLLQKQGETDAIRNLLDRAITLNVSAKRMSFFFKRYLEFEQKQGDEEKIKEIQKKALEYVESTAALDD